MAFSVKGYVLEKPRVGSANSAFTMTPDNLVVDAFAFGTAYPTSEANPRSDYLVFVVNGGDLSTATFAWTKNEVVQRFDYNGQDQRFSPLPGAAPTVVGVISPTVNTTRLKVRPPVVPTSAYPLRISVTTTGAGITLSTTTVAQDSGFTTPSSMPAMSCQISRGTGNLNFSADVVSTLNGQTVRYQQQSFFTTRESNGKIGVVGDFLVLNPIPGLGAGSAYQTPLLRIGYSPYMTAIAVATDAAFGADPPAGSFKWSAETGTVRFAPADLAAFAGKSVYYDGSCYAYGVLLPRDAAGTVGTVATPIALTNMPPAGGDLIFRLPSIGYQFPETVRVETFDAVGKKGQVQTDKLGNVQFSEADKALYGSLNFEVIRGDLPIDNGVGLRVFRSSADPGSTNASINDVTSLHTAVDAVLADPIMATPTVFLPAVPRDDGTLVVKVAQGTGSFTSTNLPRLDGASPPAGVGYVIDFDGRQLQFATRKNDQLTVIPAPTGAIQLPDPLVQVGNFKLEQETATGSGIYSPLTVGTDALLEPTSGVVQFVETFGTTEMTSTKGSLSSSTLTDTTVNFISLGIQPGDLVYVKSAPSTGVYPITAVAATQLTLLVAGNTGSNLAYEVRRGVDVLADRFFEPLSTVDPATKVERIRGFRDSAGVLIPVTNSPRMSIPVAQATRTRFRFGASTFSTSVVTVANDAAFTTPASLASGVVEVSLSTGNLNFSAANVTAATPVFAALTLQEGTEYRIKPTPGLIQTIERLLARDEMQVSYVSNDGGSTSPIVERAAFLVRKELTAAHPVDTTVLSFNPLGRTIAATPAPAVFRGGRPQVMGVTCNVDITASTIRFVDDGTITDALPHGPVVKPAERVYVDYYVYEALGGENTITVLRPPMKFTQVVLTEGSTSFTLPKDRTADLPTGHLLRVENEEVYRIASSTYSAGTDTTTVTIDASFRTALTAPRLFVSSGPCTGTYFVIEAAQRSAVPRGMNRIQLRGDRTSAYAQGTVVQFTNGLVQDLYLVSGSTYDAAIDTTTVTTTSSSAREYGSAFSFRRSIRTILEVGVKEVRCSRQPVLTQPSLVFRRTTGQPGTVLSTTDYTIDDSGRIVLTKALEGDEEVSALYTGYRMLSAGPRIRSSYTAIIAPNRDNGLEGQILKADYRIYSPDTFYYRVETLTNFRAEVAAQYEQEAKSTVPTSGPVTSNGSTQKLYEQGRESIFYREGRLANEDVIARAMLKFYNDNINLLEDVLQDIDGRVVGDRDGRFKYDGNITNPARTTYAAVTNQIDDTLKVSDAPYAVAFPPFPPVFTSIGTFQTVYKPGPLSRFFPTTRTRFTITTAGSDTSAKEGDPIADIGSKAVRSVSNIRRRIPRARIMQAAAAGAVTLTVDNANGATTLLRPAFQVGMKVIVTGADGTPYVVDGSPATVTSVAATTIGISALPVGVPAGATVYLAPSDTTYSPFSLFVGADVGLDPDNGRLTYSSGPVSSGTVTSGMFLQMDVTVAPQNTSPEKIPALFGGTTDDDGDVAVPMIGPSFARELTFLAEEQAAITAAQAVTTPTFVGTGSLDVTKTIITNSGSFPSPAPKIGDLVRILDGLNGATTYRRITAVTGSTVTVASAFTVVDSGFKFAVTVSNDPSTGAATLPTATTVQNLTTDFVAAGVKVGHTIVLTSGPATGERRQISVVTPTLLAVSTPFSSTAAANYRVTKSIATFNAMSDVTSTLTKELAVLRDNDPLATPGAITSEKLGLERFLDAVFTDVIPSQSGTVAGSVLTGTTTFQTNGVNSSHYVYIRSGSAGGIFPVASVSSETSLTISGTFPASGAVTYRVVSAFSVGKVTLNDLYCVLQGVDAFITATQNFQATTVSVGVAGDPSAYANQMLSSGFGSTIFNRLTNLTTRLTTLNNVSTGPVGKIQSVMSSGDRLYDMRFTWIENRIHVEKGVIVKKDREGVLRIKALDDQVAAITKLAAISPKVATLTPAESTYSSSCT